MYEFMRKKTAWKGKAIAKRDKQATVMRPGSSGSSSNPLNNKLPVFKPIIAA
jgi:hypothetical protein